MYRDELIQVLTRAENSPEALFDAGEVAMWTDGALNELVALGILKKASPAASVVCDECEEQCIEEIELIGKRAYIICHQREDIGRIPIDLDRLRLWCVDVAALASIVAVELGIHDPVQILTPDRLFGLGATHISERRADVFLARGISWGDSEQMFGQSAYLKEPTIAIVLLLSSADKYLLLPPHVKSLSLPRLITLDNSGIKVDINEIEQVIGKVRAGRAQNLIPFRTKSGTTWQHIVIEFVTDEEVRITDGIATEYRTFAEMGFCDRRSGQPNKLWVFLQGIAEDDGILNWKSLNGHSGMNPGLVRRRLSDVGKILAVLFPGIKDKPFKPYFRKDGYQTNFTLHWSAEMHERSGL
jgi:hypothetical protein